MGYSLRARSNAHTSSIEEEGRSHYAVLLRLLNQSEVDLGLARSESDELLHAGEYVGVAETSRLGKGQTIVLGHGLHLHASVHALTQQCARVLVLLAQALGEHHGKELRLPEPAQRATDHRGVRAI
eukprot:CAMPEP_0180740096 /NCGR_PEP_ID=MMETSP1038_2-20121128/25699_1 /TAXON_ID=632150 /ORGANISM="Azadinium spinosum, Strain 3D9" /LENGTH=125 /DNA_ID=CAMNT_0022773357 /DNA_START=85 /DNA_END=462 /DNA_ORIENTATION=-